MDEFQQQFFTFRQSEWQDYLDAHPRVLQGDLADSVYFDFISFAQYATLSWALRNGRLNFIEKYNAQGDTQVVNRATKLANNSLLPFAFRRLVGNKVLRFMFAKYPASILPPASLPSSSTAGELPFDQFLTFAQQILDIFTINCYALDCSIEAISPTEASKLVPKATIPTAPSPLATPVLFAKVRLRAPASLWSSQVLRNRKDIVNSFEIFTLESLARKYSLSFSLISTYVSNQIDVTHVVMISSGNEFDALIDDAIAAIPETQPQINL
jgi:hypothetical protein